ncbi:MAG: glutamate synthase large subunit [Gammaproteobacteria bacterium]
MKRRPPEKQGLYDPRQEHDGCGVGFVARINGGASHDIVQRGLELLVNLTHRGATGANPTTGDGAGILLQIPDEFFRAVFSGEKGETLPPRGDYACGMFFMPRDKKAREKARRHIEKILREEKIPVLGWRETPVCRDAINDEVAESEPAVRQIFAGRGDAAAGDEFERRLYAARKRMEHEIAAGEEGLYCCSFSSRTVVYKGMFLAAQLAPYYPDLSDTRFASALALVHQRFSTNTFPAWKLAHPYRCIAHNGEINTLRGNINNMRARCHSMHSPLWGDNFDKLLPLIDEGQSDTASLDNAVELLRLSGYSPAHALSVLIPEAWQQDRLMDAARRDFYAYHAPMMEPWDGPAEVVFSDGEQIAAVLDRNGLRPGRYWLTDDGCIIMASEAGVLDIPDEKITGKWFIEPGKMLVVDLRRGRLLADAEIKKELVEARPYREWTARLQTAVADLPETENAENPADFSGAELLRAQTNFAYTEEDIKFILGPMAEDAAEPIGAMGDDAPAAVLSARMRPLSAYFRQEFAQVTNPPIDPIREEIVMSLKSYLGARPDLLRPLDEQQTASIVLESPVLTPEEFAKLRRLNNGAHLSRVLDITWPAKDGAEGMEKALRALQAEALRLVCEEKCNILILSDRAADLQRAAIPACLAASAVHHHLVANGERTRAGLVVETGAAREVHDFAVLAGYGAEAVYPYLAYSSTAAAPPRKGPAMPARKRMERYRRAVGKGLLKTMSKMGVSTFQSYCGAQIFEAVGLAEEFANKYFCGTVSQIGGIGVLEAAREALFWHARAHGKNGGGRDEKNENGLDAEAVSELDAGGDYAYRIRGEAHLWTPKTIAALQHAVRGGAREKYEEYAEEINRQSARLMTLRGMLEITFADSPADLDAVEPAAEIVRRFSTGAMSFGSISREAHATLAVAMNRIGGKSNTGEGGEEAARFIPLANGDSMRSAIKQVASGRFGVTAEYLANSDMMQIKIAQGAKPGEGGQLPGHKVDADIAKVRHSVPGVGLISPPPHHDIYSIEDIAQLIYDLKSANPDGQVSVKLVSRCGVGTVAAGVVKAKSDHITIAGHDGGTGASPLSSIKHAGTPWELGLSETHQTLLLNDLRGRVALQVDGQIKTGRDVVIGALLGADEFGFATAPLVAEGCIMMRKCHLNTCPVGIATQDKRLRAKFAGKPEHVVNYFFFVAEEVRRLLAAMGFCKLDDIIGRAGLLRQRQSAHWKSAGVKLSPVLHEPHAPSEYARRHVQKQTHALSRAIDRRWLARCEAAAMRGEKITIDDEIKNTDRAAGAIIANAIAKRRGHAGLPDGSVNINLRGIGGQSFGAFAARGMTMRLCGEANDYFGKGLSGGVLAVYPPPSSRPDGECAIVGNTALYGAVCGECYCRGAAGVRFAVRNSGAHAVAERAGDHCCEYMTGGTVVVLGPVGRNFAAGMSGGVAYVLDEHAHFSRMCNMDMVSLEPLGMKSGPGRHMNRSDIDIVRGMLQRHAQYTGSPKAAEVLDGWDFYRMKFVKVLPHEYRRALMESAAAA